MKIIQLILVILAMMTSKTIWAANKLSWAANVQQFQEEMTDLKTRLSIPGLAYVVIHDKDVIAKSSLGVIQGDTKKAFSTSTPLRIASVTKSLTAVIVMQLIEEGKLNLDTPVKPFIGSVEIPSGVKLRDILTHTSEGDIGETYVYGTTRFALLGKVIESVTKQSLKSVFEERLLKPSGMAVFDSPYLGTHAGLVSSVDEMTKYFRSLMTGRLLQTESLQRLYQPSVSMSKTQLPVSLGWFAQRIQGENLVWSFGQDDPEHSGALWLYVPEKKLAVFILANVNTLSDPFRLLMGDVSKSPFAMSFIRTFVFSNAGSPIKFKTPSKNRVETQNSNYLFEQEWVSHALIDIWNNEPKDALIKMEAANAFDNKNTDTVVHFSALRLLGDETKDKALLMGERLLASQPNNRWVLLAQCYLLQQRKRESDASYCFQRILDLPNQHPDFLNRLFLVWSWTALAQMSMNDDPQKSKHYLMKVVESGVTGQSLQQAQQLLKQLK